LYILALRVVTNASLLASHGSIERSADKHLMLIHNSQLNCGLLADRKYEIQQTARWRRRRRRTPRVVNTAHRRHCFLQGVLWA